MSLISKLTHYYKLDEASGNAIDIHAGVNLTDNNTVTSAAGLINTARLYTRGNTEFHSYNGTAFDYLNTDSYSFSLWVYPVSAFGGYFTLVSLGAGIGDQRGYILAEVTTGNLARWSGFTTGVPLVQNAWNHVVYTYQSGGVNTGTETFYLNGTQIGTRTGAVPAPSLGFMQLGVDGSRNTHMFDGRIDEFSTYNAALTQPEVTQLYGAGSGFPYPLDFVAAPSPVAAQGYTCPVQMKETWTYITPDGVRYDIHNPNVTIVVSDEGTGMPPIEYVTQRGPLQHGESLINYFLRPRTIQMLVRGNGINRNDYWSMRGNLLDMIRPNRQGVDTGVLKKMRSDGTYRAFNCLIQQGPNFQPRQIGRWDEWSWQEVLRFIAFDPVAFDPTLKTISFSAAVGGLIFPITFPITFGDSTTTTNINYAGTWQEYPIIVLTGPISNPIIRNLSTGELLQLNAVLNTGEIVTFDLSYGRKTVSKGDGTNMIGFLSSDSDLGDFHLAPNPEVSNGVNQIQVQIQGGGGATSIVFKYYDRYIGF